VSTPRDEGAGTKEVDLALVQEFMAGALQKHGSLVDEPGLKPMTMAVIAGNARLSPVEQLDIYREQFWLRHIGSLRDDYPSLVHILGDERFEDLCRAYVKEHPPTSFTLRDLGDQMASFIHAEAPWKEDHLLFDIARLEWAFIEAFDAADAPPLDASTLASASEEAWVGARLRLQPSMQRLALDYPAHELRGRVRAGEDPERPPAKRVHVVIYRAGLGHETSTAAERATLQYIEVDAMAFELLEALAMGAPLGPACEVLALAHGVTDSAAMEARVGGWFQQWAAYGWISRVDFG